MSEEPYVLLQEDWGYLDSANTEQEAVEKAERYLASWGMSRVRIVRYHGNVLKDQPRYVRFAAGGGGRG